MRFGKAGQIAMFRQQEVHDQHMNGNNNLDYV